MIVLQKNLSQKEMSQDERLMTVIQTDTKTALTDNAYFIHHTERIVHTMAKLDTDPYGKPAMVYLHEGKAAGDVYKRQASSCKSARLRSLVVICRILSKSLISPPFHLKPTSL